MMDEIESYPWYAAGVSRGDPNYNPEEYFGTITTGTWSSQVFHFLSSATNCGQVSLTFEFVTSSPDRKYFMKWDNLNEKENKVFITRERNLELTSRSHKL